MELALVGEGVSASLSGPVLEPGEAGGREEEMEGCESRVELRKRRDLSLSHVQV